MKKSMKVLLIIFFFLIVILFLFISYFYNFDVKSKASNSQENEVVLNEVFDVITLETKISSYMTQNHIAEDKISMIVHNVTDNILEYVINQDQYRIAASIYKVPLAMIYYEMIINEEITYSDRLYYDRSYYEAGGEIGDTYSPGSYIPLETLLYHVIVHSDNTAGHILFENLGGWISFKQKIMKYSNIDYEPIFFTYDNVLNASYMSDVMNYLYNNREQFNDLIENMRQSQPDNYLNKEIQMNAIQKYGVYGTANNVVGIVNSKKVYSIIIFTDLGEDGISVIGELSEICYRHFNT